jgi:hypothetical protein
VWPIPFERMKANAEQLVPNRGGILKDNAAFFRRGRSGAGRELLRAEDLATYQARTATLAPPDLLAWLHRDDTDASTPKRPRPPQSLR